MRPIRVKLKNMTDRTTADISLILLCALVMIYNIPYISRNMPGVVSLGLMGLYLLLNLKSFLTLPKDRMITLILFAACITAEVIYRVAGVSTAEPYYYLNTFGFFFFFLVLMGPFGRFDKRQMKLILYAALAAILFTLAQNILLYIKNGPAHYVLLFKRQRYTSNAINTQYTSALMLLAGGMFVWFLRGKRFRWFALALSVGAVAFSTFIAQRSIVALLSVAMYGGLLLFNVKRKGARYFWGVAALVAAVVLLICAVPILNWASTKFGYRISVRLQQIAVYLETKDAASSGGSLAARYDLMARSLRTFTSSPGAFLLGVGDQRINNHIIGNHSQLIDELARYGIVGAGCMYALLFRCFQTVRSVVGAGKGSALDRQLFVIAVIVLLRGLVGTLFEPTIGVQVFMIVPILFRLAVLRQEQERTVPYTEGEVLC